MLSPSPSPRGVGGKAQDFFDATRARFETAARPDAADRTWLFGSGERLRVRFGSATLADLIGSVFAHLPSALPDGREPDFTIDAWDTATSGIGAPVSPWQGADYDDHGELRQTGWPPTLRARFNVHSGVLSMVDATRRAAIWWTRDATRLVEYERAAPFAVLLHWWHLLCPPQDGPPLFAVHAAAVGDESGGGLLLVGRGGSGKSTTTLACLAAGFRSASDDFCLLHATRPQPTAVSLYSSAKMSDPMLARFPCFAPAVANPQRPPGEKVLILLAKDFAAQCVSSLPLHAIILPRVYPGRAETRLVPATAAAALQALAPSTIFLFLRHDGEAAALFSQLADVTRRLPAFHLQLGTDADPRRTPDLLAGLLSRLAPSDPPRVP